MHSRIDLTLRSLFHPRFRSIALIVALLCCAGCFALWVVGAGQALTVAAQDLRQAAAQIDPTQPQVGPGVPQVGSNAPMSAASSSKPGSVLFFSKYTSDLTAPNNINTLLTVTNTNPRDAVSVRFLFIHDGIVESQILTLVANQSRTLVASKESPGETGYAMAVAVSAQGLPAQFNWLVGNVSLRDGRGHEASFNAYAVAKRSGGVVPPTNGFAAVDLLFNNTDYDRLPKQIAIDNLQNQDASTGPAQTTDVSLYSPLPDLNTSTPNRYQVSATAYNSVGVAFTQEQEVSGGLNASVGQIWTGVPFNTIIAVNRPGWASFKAANAEAALPVLGVSLSDSTVGLRSARNMQTLEWLESFRLSFPISAPGNPVSDGVTLNLPEATGGAQGASESKAGSILLYPRVLSGTNGSTQLHLTNTHPTQKVRLRVFFNGLVDPIGVKEIIISLPALQTTTLMADDLAANQKGWVMVVAIDSRALPIQFNHLIGSSQVTESTGQRFTFNAVALARNDANPVAREADVETADLKFDDLNYDRWPATTALSFVASQSDNATTLGLSRPAASLLDVPNVRGAASLLLYDEMLAPFSATLARTESRLNQIRPSVIQPPITNTILPGQHGWLKMLSNTPVLSWANNAATVPFAVTVNSWKGGFSGSVNLHTLTTADTFTIKVPATNPNNHPPIAVAETIGLQVEARQGDGTIVRLDGSASSDEDVDDTLSYQWFDNDQPVSSARVADRRLTLGAHTLRLVVTDASGSESAPAEQTVTVVDTLAPKLSGVPSAINKTTNSDSGEPINYALPVAYDMVDGNVPVTATIASGSPFPLGTTTVIFRAKDKSGNEATATLRVTVTKGTPGPQTGGVAGSKAPVLPNVNDQYVKVGEVRSVLLQATDADGDPLSFTLLGAPSFAQLINGDPGAHNAVLRIAPQASDSFGASNVRVTVSDGRGQSFTTLPFRVMVSTVPNDETGSGVSSNLPPIAVVNGLPTSVTATSKLGAEVLLDATGSRDPDGDALTFAWFDGDVLIARGATATVNLAVGEHVIKLTAFDGKDGLTTTAPIAIEVKARPLAATGVSPNQVKRNTTVQVTVTGTGFVAGSELRFSKEGITVAGYVSIEEDKIVANLTIAADAGLGSCDIYVANPIGTSVRLRSGLYVSR